MREWLGRGEGVLGEGRKGGVDAGVGDEGGKWINM